MYIFFLKSLLALVISVIVIVSMFTMFEIFGRSNKKFDIQKLKKYHRISGILYTMIFIVVSYFCLDFIVSTKAELTPRSTLHSLLALTILVLFVLKLLYTRIYKNYYERVKVLGLLIALITFGLVGSSAGYYLLVTEFGTDISFDKIIQYKKQLTLAKDKKLRNTEKIVIETDPESIGRGKNLFDEKCRFCHVTNSTETIVGPGLKGILKKDKLPVSGRPATPENIIRQFNKPVNRMPSFEYLTDSEVSDILAYLNTL